MIDPVTPQITTRRMRIAFQTPKATYTPSEYVKLIIFPLQQWLRNTRLNVMFM